MSALAVGAGACDTHIHFYDSTYPTAPTATLFPPDASVDQYQTVQSDLGLDRVVVVQPTTYGLDNSCQLDAMASFGQQARGVVVIDGSMPVDELARLHALGVRGARFHMLPGGAVSWEQLEPVAHRIAPFGWHVQLQLNGRELPGRLDQLLRLPTPLVVDHIGRFMPPVDVADPGFVALRRLLDAGRTWVKLSAPYESSTDIDATLPLVDALVSRAPERMLWASNWPHPGHSDGPDSTMLAQLAQRWLPSDKLRRHVLVDNPAEVYGFAELQEDLR